MTSAFLFRVSLLVVTGVWSILMMYLLVKAQQLEIKVESTVHSLSDHLVSINVVASVQNKVSWHVFVLCVYVR